MGYAATHEDKPCVIDDETEATLVDAAIAEDKVGGDRHGKRTCPKCLWTFPDTEQHWFYDKEQCKQCARSGNIGLPAKPVIEHTDASTLLSKIIEGEVVQSSRLSHLLEHVRRQFGDEQGIAQMAFSLYYDPRTKPSTQVQILKMVTALYAEESRNGNSDGKSMDDMPTEQLIAVAQQMLLGGK